MRPVGSSEVGLGVRSRRRREIAAGRDADATDGGLRLVGHLAISMWVRTVPGRWPRGVVTARGSGAPTNLDGDDMPAQEHTGSRIL